MLKIQPVDVGKNADYYATLLMTANAETKVIEVLGAKHWLGASYDFSKRETSRIYHQYAVNVVPIEINASGDPVEESLRKDYGLNTFKVTTSSDIKEETLNKNPNLMDKHRMVIKIIEWNQLGLIHTPTLDTADEDMKEFLRQWNNFGEYNKGKYTAPPSDHDDLMMAFMIGFFYAIRYIESGGLVIYNPYRDNPDPLTKASEEYEKLNKQQEQGITGLQFEYR